MKITEKRNLNTIHIDLASSSDIVKAINEEDKKVAVAVEKCLPQIAQAVDVIVENFKNGGRLFYFGAGTSGRLGVLDASECYPTFGVEDGMVVGIIAGGERALRHSVENAEDSDTAGVQDLMAQEPNIHDTVVGLSAGGSAKYVLAVLRKAQELGIKTVGYSSNPDALLAEYSDVFINPIVGEEVLTGSSRMKSGTAQKMVLNMLSTASMIRLGKIYENLMIDVRTTNDKLRDRACRIISDIAHIEYEKAEALLKQAQDFLQNSTKGVPLATVMGAKNCSPQRAFDLLKKNGDSVRRTLEEE